jgi:hypothetical protein
MSGQNAKGAPPVMDTIFVLVTLAFFGVALAYTAACARL